MHNPFRTLIARKLFATLLLLAPLLIQAQSTVYISEFLARNKSVLADEDGAFSDWIEIYNDANSPTNLAGWFLTDTPTNLTKWVFPSTNVAAKDFLIVFASGKNRTTPGLPLHTSFSLDGDAGYLALVMPDGVTVASSFNYGAQKDDASFGLAQNTQVSSLVGPTAPARVRVPPDGALGLTWTAPGFNDGTWLNGLNGIGYETSIAGFVVTNYKASITVDTLNAAKSVIANASQRSAAYSENASVINYLNTGGSINFANDSTFPGLSIGVDVEDFVLDAYGTITIPAAGNWTFGVNSDDGFQLDVGPFTMSAPDPRGPTDSLQTFNFAAAGTYPIHLIYYERGGGAECELFAAQGSFTTFAPANFRLVGDVANGGLAVRAPALPGSTAGFRPLIATDIQSQMYNVNPSVFVRIPFTLADASIFTSLTLQMKYADGFVAYLNGQEVARRNAPGTVSWNSAATADHTTSAALVYENINISDRVNLLQNGNNVLAIQGLNRAANEPDFFMSAALTEFKVLGNTNRYFVPATPLAANGAGYLGFVGDTSFDHDRGFYSSPFSLSITSSTPNAVIRYTTNGSAPTATTGFPYTGPLTIDHTTIIRAAAFSNGYYPSDVDAQTYIFVGDVLRQSPGGQQPWPEWPAPGSATQIYDYGMDPDIVNNPVWGPKLTNSLLSLPSFSIVMDLADLFSPQRGIYANPSGDERAWERPGSVELIYPDGTKGFQINCGIRVRGGFSRDPSNPKHAFRFFFRSDYGASKLNFPLFGPGGADEFDKIDLRTFQNYSWAFQNDSRMIMLRDQFSRDAELAMTGNAERGEFYHLYINGQYWGIYNTDERPEAAFGATYYGGSRTNWDAIKVDPDLGYNIETTDGNFDAWTRLWNQAVNGFTTDSNYFKVQGLNVDGTVNPAYENLLDIDQLIDYMLVIYYGGNLDAPISNFLANNSPNNFFGIRDRSGTNGGFRFFAHDSEHTLLDVNADRTGPFSAGAPSNGGLPKSNPQYFFQQLAANAEFRIRLADHVQKHCFNGGVLSTAGARNVFLSRSNQLDAAVYAESARWGDSKRAVPFTYNDWKNAMTTVANDFMGGRTPVLISQLRGKGWFPSLGAPIFSQFGGAVPSGYNLTMSHTNATGIMYYTLDGSDPRLRGGALSSSAIAYGGPITINTHLFVRARVKDGANWSAIVEAHFYPDQDFGSLLLTEIMYNPLPSGTNTSDDLEFLEFKNAGTNVIDLSGLRFSAGITHAFTNGTRLNPGQFWVIGRSAASLASRYPGLVVNGIYTGRLDNGGELIAITNALGINVISVTYRDSAPWSPVADGHGFSLVPVNPNSNPDNDNASNWRASSAVGGSPGADDPASTTAPILINELLTHTDFPTGDQIELYNPTASPVDIGGWFLSDDPSILTKFRIPPGTIIDPLGFRVFSEAQFNPTPGATNSFGLSSLGEDLYLVAADANTNLLGYSHSVTFGPSATNVSFGRYIISTGEELFPAQAALSLDSANVGPRVGPVVINEIMYHPDLGFDEFIELRNVTGSAVSLFDPNHATNTWKLTGLSYSFPQSVVLPANEFLLVVPIDPAAFRSKYNVPGSVQIFGPYAGVLQDSGERLELKFPLAPTTNGVIPYITMDEVRYNDKAPWPPAADGGGPSLQRLVSTAYGNDPTNWFASGVTPGRNNGANVPPIVSVTAPANNAVFNAPVDVPISADASDPDGGGIVKVEFYADGEKIGEDATNPYSIIWSNALTGSHAITARAIDSNFAAVFSTPLTVTINPYPVGSGTGLKGDYYDNQDFTAFRLSRVDPTVNFDWLTGSPDPLIGPDQFTVRWTGIVQPRLSGTFTFYTVSDDGVRLWVDNQPLIDNWTDHGPTEDSGSILLSAGQPYQIRMDFYENGGGATAKLLWSATGLPKEAIPQTQLYAFTNTDTQMISQPVGTNVLKGSNFTLRVVVSGFQPRVFQWFRDSNAILGATNTLLTVTNAQLSDAGSYTVSVTDASTNILSNPAIVNVWEPPVLTAPIPPIRATVTAGNDFTISGTASGTLPINFSWRRNFIVFTNLTLFNNTSTLLLTNIQPSTLTGLNQTNTYTVRLTNIAAAPVTLFTVAILKVLNPPVITNQPIGRVSGVSSNVSFSIGVRGGTPQRNQWYKDGAPLLNQTNLALNLTNIQVSSEGNYYAIVTNLEGSVTSATAQLIIDSDHDGIPDSYELAHGLKPNDPSDASGDADLDGMSNLAEYIAGTDASDPASYLKINGSANAGNASLTFLAITNRAYTIESRLLVHTGTWTTLTNIPASFSSNRLISVTHRPAGTNQQVYRLVTQKVQ